MQVTLTIDNSMSKIEGLPSGPFNKLRKLLSYSADPQSAYFSGGYGPRIKYLIDKQGSFPTGLLSRVVSFLHDSKIRHTLVEMRRKPASQSNLFKLKESKYD